MPKLKMRNLFISHAWKYDSHYETLVKWFDDEANFDWKNYSVPEEKAFEEKTDLELKKCLTNQIKPSSCVIILAGMWAAHSEWIQYEVDEAIRLEKTIIGVEPWGQKKSPEVVTDAADTMVKWQKEKIIEAIREKA